MDPKPNLEEQAKRLSDDSELGYSSEVVLKGLEPIIERRLSALLDEFSICLPELGPLLDVRAKICEVWRIRKQLKSNEGKGKMATMRMEAILSGKNVSDNRTP